MLEFNVYSNLSQYPQTIKDLLIENRWDHSAFGGHELLAIIIVIYIIDSSPE